MLFIIEKSVFKKSNLFGFKMKMFDSELTEIEKFIPDEQLQQPEITITYKVKQSAEKPE